MATALKMLIEQEYVSKFDEDKKKTVWIFRTLTGFEAEKAYDNTGNIDKEYILETALTGWKNFVDGAGKDIEFSKPNMALIPTVIMVDIAINIINESVMTEEERKNSSSQS